MQSLKRKLLPNLVIFLNTIIKYLDYTDCFVNFEFSCRNICNLGVLSNEHLDFLKTRTKETVLSSYQNYNNNVQQSLSKKECQTLQNLSKNKYIFNQKSGKGNSVVIFGEPSKWFRWIWKKQI